MLFEQIEPALRRRISAEAKIDVKLASLTWRQAEHPQATRIAKLRWPNDIDTHHRVGPSLAPGGDYFRGSLPMQWGWPCHRARRSEAARGGGRSGYEHVSVPCSGSVLAPH